MKIEELTGSAPQISADLENFRLNIGYVETNYSTLQGQYADEWVAVHNQKVIGHHQDVNRLIDELQNNGIQMGNVYVAKIYCNEEEPTFILGQ